VKLEFGMGWAGGRSELPLQQEAQGSSDALACRDLPAGKASVIAPRDNPEGHPFSMSWE
jgi:hypothetical protein